jgi:two-component system, NarL family, nitrate/nitrite response regulator NarL
VSIDAESSPQPVKSPGTVRRSRQLGQAYFQSQPTPSPAWLSLDSTAASPAVRSDPVAILVAGDDPLVREGLRALLSSQPDFIVIGQVHDERDALRQLRETTPDILLLDVTLLGPFGLDTLDAVSKSSTSRPCQTIMLTAATGNQDIVTWLRHGVRGVLSRHSSIDLIFKCVRTVHRGEVWIARDMMTPIVEALSRSMHHQRRPSPADFRLTRREHQILQLIVQGDTNKGIAGRLAVSEDTVKHHLTNIFDKTGASNRLELALFAVHHRLVAVDGDDPPPTLVTDPASLAALRRISRPLSGHWPPS